MQIEGLRAMLVGGASGMARATAERIAAGGGSVAIVDQARTTGTREVQERNAEPTAFPRLMARSQLAVWAGV